VIAGKAPDLRKAISYDPKKLKTLGGSDLSDARQKEILTALGFTLDGWKVTTPPWRHDIDGVADIVEEVLRIDGYDNIPAVSVISDRKPPALNALQKRMVNARRALAVRGLFETVTWSFIDDARADLFGVANKQALTLVNPISADMAVMRPSVLPNLVEAAGRSADKGFPDGALFEIGGIYRDSSHTGQATVASGLRISNARPRHWSAAARTVDALDAKADALAALEACGVNANSLQITTDAPAWYHPGRSGVLRLGRDAVAHFGELHPSLLATLKRDETFAAFEVFLDAIPAPKKKGTRKELLKLSPFQPVSRDFAFIVDAGVEADKIAKTIKLVDRVLITGVDIFDVYQGKGVDPDKKSVGIAVTLQPIEKTLTDEEINALCKKIVEAVQKATNATLRA
jgi:phenylalanyl-tRNA synthetase beta chain